MKLYRLRLTPRAAWLTPWQSDTLSGLLCCIHARTHGAEALRREIIDPAERGAPRFVLSDAFPDDLLPLPCTARLRDWPAEDRKKMKRAGWIHRTAFSRYRADGSLALQDLREAPLVLRNRLRNTLDRLHDATGAEGSLFPAAETVLKDEDGAGSRPFLSVYARIEDGFEASLYALFHELSQSGFGADVSAGFGQLEVTGAWEPAEDLDRPVDGANGIVSLSTCQPGFGDPTEGSWDAFVKYGKVGPDFGLDNVFKRPLVLFRPGACFRMPEPRGFIGRAIPMVELLSRETCDVLRARGANVLHLAFGLAVSARLPWEAP
jgi:CRISPR-associated protein Csm4